MLYIYDSLPSMFVQLVQAQLLSNCLLMPLIRDTSLLETEGGWDSVSPSCLLTASCVQDPSPTEVPFQGGHQNKQHSS